MSKCLEKVLCWPFGNSDDIKGKSDLVSPSWSKSYLNLVKLNLPFWHLETALLSLYIPDSVQSLQIEMCHCFGTGLLPRVVLTIGRLGARKWCLYCPFCVVVQVSSCLPYDQKSNKRGRHMGLFGSSSMQNLLTISDKKGNIRFKNQKDTICHVNNTIQCKFHGSRTMMGALWGGWVEV